jgi:hypothetical protein
MFQQKPVTFRLCRALFRVTLLNMNLETVEDNMAVLERFRGIVVRLIYDRTLGARLHAFYEGAELVVAMQPLRVLQGEVPQWVKEWVLGWAREHMHEVVQFGAAGRPAPLWVGGGIHACE